MRLASWNVNSLKVRLPHVLGWLATQQPDVLCLQETKLEDPCFPLEALKEAGYQAIYAGQKTYNGVAILSRHPITEIMRGIPDWVDEQQRVLSATIQGIRIICVYVPNGQDVDSDKYQYKLRWLSALHDWLGHELSQYPHLAVLGDFNIAPYDTDVYDAAELGQGILVSPAERAAFSALLELGLEDSFSTRANPGQSFTWWDYRAGAFRRNRGLRIDHILLSTALAKNSSDWQVDTNPRKQERPSDHAPVMVTAN